MNMILETATRYWTEFQIMYSDVLGYGAWKVVSVLLPIIITLGVIRSAYNYAKGNEIGEFHHSMISLRILDRLFTLLGGQDHTSFRQKGERDADRNQLYILIPIGSHFFGALLDSLVFVLVTLAALLIWPGILFISMTIGPLHISRVYNLRKKRFIANLKGEKASA